MESGILKAPAELLASRVKAFKNCLELATACLTNKDYSHAEIIYGGILADLHKDCLIESLNLNDLELFSLHICFAYSSIGDNFKSEQALVILNSIHKPIKLPLVPYLKAFIHISSDRMSFASDELQCCQTLLTDGYNFKPNSILNEEIVPEINDEFLKLKLNGLRFACDLIKAREDNDDLKRCFKENWLKIGKLCETDFAKLARENKAEETPKARGADKKAKHILIQTGAIRKIEKQIKNARGKSKTDAGVQVSPPKGINASVQTVDKDVNKQLLATVIEIRNKLNNLQSKKDSDIKQLQKKNDDLNEKLLAKENKRVEKLSEFEFLKDQYCALEKKFEQSQRQNGFLQKLLIEQLQQKCHMQKNIYQLFEERCDFKIEFLSDLQKYLKPGDKVTVEECRREVFMWQGAVNKISASKKNFDTYFRSVDDLITAKKYSTVKTNDWPVIPNIPTDAQDMVYRVFKNVIQQDQLLSNVPYPNYYSAMLGNYQENFHNPNYLGNSYNTYKEDGRTTGSPPTTSRDIQPPWYVSNENGKVDTKPKKHEFPISPPPDDNGDIYQAEKDLLKYVESNFEDIDEFQLWQAICHVRDANGGTLVSYPKQLLVNEVKKFLKRSKSTKFCWSNVGQVQWHNDHTESRCCICFDDYDATNSYTLSCQHEFHKKCITNWLKRQSACPVCRVHAIIDEDFPPLKS